MSAESAERDLKVLPLDYTAFIERGGIEVRVTVEVAPHLKHDDVDELAEVVAHAATQVSARAHESIARGSLPF